jgi:uncharacterized membrane protein
MSERTVLPSQWSTHWVLRSPGRIYVSLLAGVLSALPMLALSHEMWLIVSLDVVGVVYVTLFYVLMSVTSPQESIALSRHREPSGIPVLIVTMLVALVSFGAVAALLDVVANAPPWLKVLHLICSVLVLFLSWIVLQISFGLRYMKMYYDEVGADTPEPDLEFPTHSTPDLWDFMYYSFTIAMCYQTSDVTINAPDIRRLTLLHAIFSFFYVALIISLVVNLLSNVI